MNFNRQEVGRCFIMNNTSWPAGVTGQGDIYGRKQC